MAQDDRDTADDIAPDRKSSAASKQRASVKSDRAAESKTKKPPKTKRRVAARASSASKTKTAGKAAAGEPSAPAKSQSRGSDILWLVCGILFFAGAAFIALAILALMTLTHVIARLFAEEFANNVQNAAATVSVYLRETVAYIADPSDEMPYPFKAWPRQSGERTD